MTRARTAPHPNDEAAPAQLPAPWQPWIVEPGHYPDLTDEDYHRDPVVGGSLSSTGARTLIRDCPAKFDHERRHGRPEKDVFDRGRAAHSLVLGVGAPVASLPFDSRRSNAYKAAEKRARDNGEIPLLEADADEVVAMATALDAHPVAGPLLRRPGRAEQSYVARDPESGVMCRARADWLPDVPPGAPLQVVDYKTTRSAHPRKFAKSIADFGYYQQAAFYLDVLRWLGRAADGAVFVLIAQETEAPYLVGVYTLRQSALEWGQVLNRKARDLYRHCTDTGTWPGYPAGPVELDLPGWAENALDTAELRGEFDTIGDTA